MLTSSGRNLHGGGGDLGELVKFMSFYLQKVTFNWLLTNVGVGDCNWLLTRVGVGDCNWLLTKVGVDVCNWLLTKVGVDDVCN